MKFFFQYYFNYTFFQLILSKNAIVNFYIYTRTNSRIYFIWLLSFIDTHFIHKSVSSLFIIHIRRHEKPILYITLCFSYIIYYRIRVYVRISDWHQRTPFLYNSVEIYSILEESCPEFSLYIYAYQYIIYMWKWKWKK